MSESVLTKQKHYYFWRRIPISEAFTFHLQYLRRHSYIQAWYLLWRYSYTRDSIQIFRMIEAVFSFKVLFKYIKPNSHIGEVFKVLYVYAAVFTHM
jgi:hypothetical protein